MIKKRGLGTGLEVLLSDVQEKVYSKNDKTQGIRTLGIDLLKPGRYQPRQSMNKENLSELAESIRSQGIIQPIIVRPVGSSYEIIAGERRFRAAQLANLHEVPVVIREIPDKNVMAISLIENIQREDLNVIDAAMGIQRLIEEFSMTHENAAEAIGKSRTAVTNLLRLLSLSEEIKNMVKQSLIEMGHARALLSLDLVKQQVAVKIIVAKKLSVRESELLVRKLQGSEFSGTKKNVIDPNVKQLQADIAGRLAASVSIQHTKKGKGKITIKYNSLDELEGILKHIK